MKLTLQLQLLPTAEQKADLLATMERFNEAAAFAAKQGFATKLFGQVNIHRLAYRAIREHFGLSSQMAVRAIAKAVETFRRDKTKCPKFKKHGAITYDERVLSFKGLTEVSLWGLAGRHRIAFVCGAYQRALQGRIKGQADLVYRDKKFFLLCTIDLPDGAPVQTTDALGVDLGIVAKAKATGSVIVLEELKHMRRRVSVQGKQQRARHAGWSFGQLRLFVEYNARLAGISVILVDPRNTSRTCSQCGHCDKGNRKIQAEFRCLHCGYSTNADYNAARNIRARAASTGLMVGVDEAKTGNLLDCG